MAVLPTCKQVLTADRSIQGQTRSAALHNMLHTHTRNTPPQLTRKDQFRSASVKCPEATRTLCRTLCQAEVMLSLVKQGRPIERLSDKRGQMSLSISCLAIWSRVAEQTAHVVLAQLTMLMQHLYFSYPDEWSAVRV